jgi:hypothetical protein
MKRFLCILALLACTAPSGAVEIFGVEAIEPGMKGVGYTAWHGTDVEPFDIEVVGVLRHFGPGRHLILAEARGGPLEESGIPGGISGSPVYIDDRLVGACAFTWSFTKKPVVGITPMEYMLDLMSREDSGKRAGRHLDLPPYDPASVHALADGAEPVFLEPLRRLFQRAEPSSGLVPIAVPLSLSGLSGRGLEPFRGLLGDLGLVPVAAGSMAGGAEDEEVRLVPGSPVGASLIRGALRMDAYGTVTYVAGEHLFAFGHPFFDMGPVEFPLSAGWVQTIVPRASSSFKVVSPIRDVGVFLQDRQAGMYGVVGREPRMVPMQVELERGDGVVETHDFELIRDPGLTPLLGFIALQEVFGAAERAQGESTVEVLEESYIDIAGFPSVGLQNLYSGPNAAWEAAGALSSYLAWILNNEFEEAEVAGVTLRIRVTERIRTAAIQRVQFGRSEVRPGETVPVEIFLKPFRGKLLRETIDVEVPADLPDGRLVLTVGSASAVDRLTRVPVGARLNSLQGLLDLVEGQRRNANVYVQLSRKDDTLLVDGTYLSNLPPTMEAMFRSDRVRGGAAVFTRTEILEEEIPIPYRVQGLHLAPLEVRSE